MDQTQIILLKRNFAKYCKNTAIRFQRLQKFKRQLSALLSNLQYTIPFSNIDYKSMGVVDQKALQLFLIQFGHFHKPQQINQYFIKYSHEKQVLYYDDFLQALLPHSDFVLLSRQIHKQKYLCQRVEDSVSVRTCAYVISKEIQFMTLQHKQMTQLTNNSYRAGALLWRLLDRNHYNQVAYHQQFCINYKDFRFISLAKDVYQQTLMGCFFGLALFISHEQSQSRSIYDAFRLSQSKKKSDLGMQIRPFCYQTRENESLLNIIHKKVKQVIENQAKNIANSQFFPISHKQNSQIIAFSILASDVKKTTLLKIRISKSLESYQVQCLTKMNDKAFLHLFLDFNIEFIKFNTKFMHKDSIQRGVRQIDSHSIEQISQLIAFKMQEQIEAVHQQKYIHAQRVKNEILVLENRRDQLKQIHRKNQKLEKSYEDNNNPCLLQIQNFKLQWDELIQQLIYEYADLEAQLKGKQKKQLIQLQLKYEQDKQNILLKSKAIPPLPKIVQTKKKIDFHVRNRQYAKAELLNKQIKVIFNQYQKKNRKQVQKQIKLQKSNLDARHKKQLQVFHAKFEQMLNQKVAYRDKTLQILNNKAKVQGIRAEKRLKTRQEDVYSQLSFTQDFNDQQNQEEGKIDQADAIEEGSILQ